MKMTKQQCIDEILMLINQSDRVEHRDDGLGRIDISFPSCNGEFSYQKYLNDNCGYFEYKGKTWMCDKYTILKFKEAIRINYCNVVFL